MRDFYTFINAKTVSTTTRMNVLFVISRWACLISPEKFYACIFADFDKKCEKNIMSHLKTYQHPVLNTVKVAFTQFSILQGRVHLKRAFEIQSTLAISNSGFSNSAKLEASTAVSESKIHFDFFLKP